MKYLNQTYQLETHTGPITFILCFSQDKKYYGRILTGGNPGATNNGFQITPYDLKLYLKQGLARII